jgi:uncharacterized membrane protein YdfJ with MMPL/SSD domain
VGRALYRIGSLAARRRWLFLGGWLVVAAGLIVLVQLYGANTSDNLSLPGTDSQRAADLLASQFPPRQNGTSPIVFNTTTGKVTDAQRKQAIEASRSAIVELPHVYSATDPFSQQGQTQISKDGQTAFIPVLLDVGSADLTQEIAESVLAAAEPGVAAGMQVAAGGPIGSELSEPEAESSELIGILAAMLILLFAFGTVVAMGMPIVTAVVGLAVGLAAIGLLGHLATVPSIAPTLAVMIGLGVGIDYALFLVSRHRSHLREGMELHESIALTVATSGSAVVYAGGTVVIALLALAVAGIPLVTALGYASAVAVATAVVAAVTLLPALLSVVGRRIDSLRLPILGRKGPKKPGTGLWAGWARIVTRHPGLVVLGALLLLAPLLIPFRSLEFGQEDIGATPKSTTERQAYDLMTAGFGVGYNGPLLIAVELGTPASPSSEYESQLSQATSLKQELEQEQTTGTTQKTELQQQAAQLQREQSALEQQQTSLEQQEAALQRQSDQLQTEQAALRRQGQSLEQSAARAATAQRALAARQAAIAREALALERRIGSTTRALAENRARIRVTEAGIARAQSPRARRALEARLRVLERRRSSLESQLAALGRQEQKVRARERFLRAAQSRLRAQEKALAAETAALARQAYTVAGESAALLQQKHDLEQEADALQLQAAQLQTQSANLQTQQAQLEGAQQQATTQQQQAESLQSELTQELTKAGGDARGTDARLVRLQDALGGAPDVSVVSPPQINETGTAATFGVIAKTSPASTETADVVRTLRTYTIPQATTGSDVEAYVGGYTASYVDLAAEIASRLYLVIIAVIALSFLVLMAAYRSVVVPAQAALANVLSVAAAFGVLTAVFQWGWGLGLVGLDTSSGTVPIASYVPLMMFAVLFGLSMDYQVFLLSQIQHHRTRGEGTATAVASGIEASARVIVAAALIMMSVFGSFVLSDDPTIKQFGVGLSAGVALAAFMVLTFAPAVLVIVGRASWWLPDALGRILPRLDIEGTAQLGEATTSAPGVGPPPTEEPASEA